MSNINGPVIDMGQPVRRPLHFFWLVDYSYSMQGSKIETLNRAIHEVVPEIIHALENHPEVQIMMRAIKFSTEAGWHIGPDAVPIENFHWPDLKAEGYTATASAIGLLCDELHVERMSKRAVPPVCILLSDGYCTDPEDAYKNAIARLDSMPWGKKAVRLVIGIGQEGDYNEQELLLFCNQPNVGVLKASTSGELIEYIKWASTAATLGASVTKSADAQADIAAGSNVVLSDPPDISHSGVVF